MKQTGDRTTEQTLGRLLVGGYSGTARLASPGLRIFIDPSSYQSSNAGDLAMLTVALQRVRALWPSAAITVQTLDPPVVQGLDPAAATLDPFGSRGWSADAFLVARAVPPTRGVNLALDAYRWIKRRQPWLARALGSTALRTTCRGARLLHHYLRAVTTADLVMLSGAGSINDEFCVDALIRLETLELARQAGATTALLGQGLGPIDHPVLRARAASVLSQVDFLGLREGLGSLALLDSLGATPHELAITGDDAVVLGYEARRSQPGTALGVNLRVASYSGIDRARVDSVGIIVRAAAARLGTELVPIPISRHPVADDALTGRHLLGNAATTTPSHEVASPAPVLEALQRCRLVVVGSYHAAVFALSMGIPAVMIAGSPYYEQKLRGVAHQFGIGCQVELAAHPDFAARLRGAIDVAWATADETRDGLLTAARKQMGASEAAYRRLFELVETRITRCRQARGTTWRH
jgi:polysaccharide pyruvyl transferase WcaK-like protein